jgi:hypothetical protein
MLRRMAPVVADVSEERIASIIRGEESAILKSSCSGLENRK